MRKPDIGVMPLRFCGAAPRPVYIENRVWEALRSLTKRFNAPIPDGGTSCTLSPLDGKKVAEAITNGLMHLAKTPSAEPNTPTARFLQSVEVLTTPAGREQANNVLSVLNQGQGLLAQASARFW